MLEIFYLDGSEAKKAHVKDILRLKNKRIWIDITDPHKDDISLLHKILKLHPLTEEDLLKENERIKVEEFPEYLFCVFNGVSYAGSRLAWSTIKFLANKNCIVTAHKKELANFESLKKEKERLSVLLGKGPDFVLHSLLDAEVEEYMPILQKIDDEIEHVDEIIASKHMKDVMKTILKLKREIIELKKVLINQREKISTLSKIDFKFISNDAKPYFRDVYDESILISDLVENQREMISSSVESYMSAINVMQNDVMKFMTTVATVALPLTVISSIYGTNFKILPGSGHDLGFWIMICAMLIIVFSMATFFRRKGWF
jgi:magnesium transporter